MRRLRRWRRFFRVGVWSAVAISFALVRLGEFWIGVAVAAIATVLVIVWLEAVREPTRRYNAKTPARGAGIAAKLGALGQRPDG